MPKAYIAEIQKFCVHDGPGIRTTVFFQGCPLNCKWCQNPETISLTPVLTFDPELCSGCGSCLENCKNKAISITKDNLPGVHESLCIKCHECCDACYFLARKFSSHEMSVDALMEAVMKDEAVYRQSGGGVTVSGGEPLLQKDFILKFLGRLKENNIHTAVETAGFVPETTVLAAAEVTDTFLFDLKLFSSELHEKWIGVPNQQILQNIRHLTDIHHNVVIRVPLIPGVNDTDEEFGKMMDFVSTLQHINSVHILPFHHFGSRKYELIGRVYEMGGVGR